MKSGRANFILRTHNVYNFWFLDGAARDGRVERKRNAGDLYFFVSRTIFAPKRTLFGEHGIRAGVVVG